MLPCAFRIKFTYYWGEWLWVLQKAIDSTGTAKDYAKKQVSLILTSLNKQLCNERWGEGLGEEEEEEEEE